MQGDGVGRDIFFETVIQKCIKLFLGDAVRFAAAGESQNEKSGRISWRTAEKWRRTVCVTGRKSRRFGEKNLKIRVSNISEDSLQWVLNEKFSILYYVLELKTINFSVF